MTAYRTSQVIPFANLAEINREYDPPSERKCIACAGEGVLPVFDVHGEQRCVATCPICGGTRYEP